MIGSIKEKEDKQIDFDERQNPIMTSRTLKYYCEKQGGLSTPELNDKLYLQYKGFLKIVPETISQYNNLLSLWLNNNGIKKIEGLDNLIHLKSLALNNNSIERIEGLDNLFNLAILNLSNNKIQIVEGLTHLRKLQTINLAHNFLVHDKAIEAIQVCQSLTTLDLSQNDLESTEDIFEQIVCNKNIKCLYLKSTPFARSFKNYRKRLIASLKHLKFLDDRPVLEQDHRLSQAWIHGGIEFQRQEKQRIAEEKNKREEMERDLQKSINLQIQQQKANSETLQSTLKSAGITNSNKQPETTKLQQSQQVLINKSKQESTTQAQISQSKETQILSQKVNEILGNRRSLEEAEQQNACLQRIIARKWKPKYQKILQTLLLRYKFDFSEVQPSFNMILSDINKKLLRSPVRFEIQQLRKIWTKIQLRKRSPINQQ